MLATVHTYALLGIDATPVRVEVDLASGAFPGLVLVGLPDAAIRESRERIISALRNQGFRFPDKKTTVNLAPADLRKEGVGFDLPIAIGILVASGQAPPDRLLELSWAGELSLDGRIHPVRGSLSMAVAEATRPESRRRILVLPRGNGAEALAAGEIEVAEVGSLREVAALLADGDRALSRPQSLAPPPAGVAVPLECDLADVRGQAAAQRAVEVAAAGGHNLLLIGSPGTGKSMLAERLPGILPPLTRREQLEATMIHSVAGLLAPGTGLISGRPFRAPHHTVSEAGLVGGGRPPRPGEVSLAHRGVLFLDELPEFRRHVLEGLRQPLEAGEVTLVRAGATVRLPARFQLVAAMNPCPCGRRLDPRGGCGCTPKMIERYLGRISGPLLERIDIHLEMARVGFGELVDPRPGEDSASVRGRVIDAWGRQQGRFRDAAGRNGGLCSASGASDEGAARPRVFCNAQMGLTELRAHCRLASRPLGLLRMAVGRLGLSPRAFHRVLRLSRTIADLAGSEEIAEEHVAEAISYRLLDRGFGGMGL